jgi:molybdenum cofactor biosynthesis enzyme MoaA
MFNNIKQVIRSKFNKDKLIITCMVNNYCNYSCEYCCEEMQFKNRKKIIDLN